MWSRHYGGEKEIRASFDALLEFFSKLEYLRMIGLILQEDLSYFQYYIKKASDDPAVCKYVKDYKF